MLALATRFANFEEQLQEMHQDIHKMMEKRMLKLQNFQQN